MASKTKIIQYNFKDFTVDADVTSGGKLQIVSGATAIENALRVWLTSFSGECVRNPNGGGNVSRWLFKPITQDTQNEIIMAIREGLDNDFRPYLTLENLEVTPNFEGMYWTIAVTAYCPSANTGVYVIEKLRKIT